MPEEPPVLMGAIGGGKVRRGRKATLMVPREGIRVEIMVTVGLGLEREVRSTRNQIEVEGGRKGEGGLI